MLCWALVFSRRWLFIDIYKILYRYPTLHDVNHKCISMLHVFSLKTYFPERKQLITPLSKPRSFVIDKYLNYIAQQYLTRWRSRRTDSPTIESLATCEFETHRKPSFFSLSLVVYFFILALFLLYIEVLVWFAQYVFSVWKQEKNIFLRWESIVPSVLKFSCYKFGPTRSLFEKASLLINIYIRMFLEENSDSLFSEFL